MRKNEIEKMGSGRAPQKSLFIRNACYKAKIVLGFFEMRNYCNIANNKIKTKNLL